MGVPLAERVVEVIADLGAERADRYRYGSGCLVGGATVLTAAHVVAGATAITVRDAGKRSYAARTDPGFVGEMAGPGPDLALVDIVDPDFEGPLEPMVLVLCL